MLVFVHPDVGHFLLGHLMHCFAKALAPHFKIGEHVVTGTRRRKEDYVPRGGSTTPPAHGFLKGATMNDHRTFTSPGGGLLHRPGDLVGRFSNQKERATALLHYLGKLVKGKALIVAAGNQVNGPIKGL